MKKADRQKVFDKYGGKCAYCGCQLQKGWHVDHVEPVMRKTKTIHQHWKHKVTGEILQQNEGLRRLNKMDDAEHRNWEYQERREVPDGFDNPENHCIENMFPACASCNIQKHRMSIEDFRTVVSGFVNSLNQYHTIYAVAKRYGLVEETGKPVVFYFETAPILPDNSKTDDNED